MKKISYLCSFFALLLVFSVLSSCRSIETDATVTAAASAGSVSTVPVQNGEFVGIALDGEGVTAATAELVPDFANTGTNKAGVLADDDTLSSITAGRAEETSASTVGGGYVTATVSEMTAGKAETTTAATAASTTTAAVSSGSAAAETTVSAAVSSGSAAGSSAATAAPETEETTTTAAQTTTAAETAAETAETTTAAAAHSYTKNSYKAVNHSYVRAAWISYIELHNHLYGKNETEFRREFGDMMDHCRSAGINTVYVHVRAFGDAYYYSSLFPFTKQLTGTINSKTSFDPLKIMVSEAHTRGMSFHAWINPMRLCSDSDMSAVPQDYPIGKWYKGSEKGRYIVNVNGTWYLNPAYSEVLQLIGDNVREIVSSYDVDGVHIDDYFYPTTDASFDSTAFAESGSSSLSAFRIANCSSMVKTMHDAAHECSSAWFGAAPQGNNNNNLNQLYADVRAWCAGGYIDYFTPQIYYGFEHAYIPFNVCVDEWAGIIKGTDTKLYAGLSVYKAGAEDKWAGAGKYEWQNHSDILKRQVEYADANGCSGAALYSYSYLFDSGYANAATKAEFDGVKKLFTGQ